MNNKALSFIKNTNKIFESKTICMLICFMAGILGYLPYCCEDLFICTFLALFILFFVIIKQRNGNKGKFIPFFCYFIGFFVPLYSFLSELYPYERFGFTGGQAKFVLVCSCIIIPLIHALVVAAIMNLSKILPQKPFLASIGFASLWVVGEWILTLGTLAFPWSNISVSLVGFLPYIQTASLFGKYFVSFITAFACCLLAFSAVCKKRFFALIAIFALLLNTVIGTFLWYIPSESEGEIKVTALQGNVLSNEKWDTANRGSIYDLYITMAEESAKEGCDIILLPETAIPLMFTEKGPLYRSFAEIASQYNVTILSGVNYREKSQYFNSVIAVFPDGSISERYDKRHLVPFGEFIPFVDTLGKLIPFVARFNEASIEYGEGDKSVVIPTEKGKIAPLVCFDSIFSQFAKDGCENGAEILAVVTNDSWFNDSDGIYTHLRHSQIRAIENGRFVMRAANTGISAFINEKGQVIKRTEALTEATVTSPISVINTKTFYTVTGDWGLYISLTSILYFIIFYFYRRKKNGNN